MANDLCHARDGHGQIFDEGTSHVPFIETLQTLATANAVLLVDSDETHDTASMIYWGRISVGSFPEIFHESNSAQAILSRSGGGVAQAFASESTSRSKVRSQADILVRLTIPAACFSPVSPNANACVTANNWVGRSPKLFRRFSTT